MYILPVLRAVVSGGGNGWPRHSTNCTRFFTFLSKVVFFKRSRSVEPKMTPLKCDPYSGSFAGRKNGPILGVQKEMRQNRQLLGLFAEGRLAGFFPIIFFCEDFGAFSPLVYPFLAYFSRPHFSLISPLPYRICRESIGVVID